MGIFNRKKEENTKDKNTRKDKKVRWIIFFILVVGLSAAFLDYPAAWDKSAEWVNRQIGADFIPHFIDTPFKLGLDLQGGTHLVYQADLTNIDPEDYADSMQGVRDVIERRVNMFGVAEPVVQVNKVGSDYRLIVELAGIKDAHQAIEMIGQTPSLDFRKARGEEETKNILEKQEGIKKKLQEGEEINEEETEIILKDPYFEPTELTGRYLKNAELQFDQQTYQPQVNLQFDDEGSAIFERLTSQSVGQQLAIYLDGAVISAPVVQEIITGGRAQITGQFSMEEAKKLVQRLNAGALPVPINLINQQTVGASLGYISLEQSLKAGSLGFLLILVFLIFYYRLPGLLSSLALLIYLALVLAVLKLIPVTLTLAGIAGIILSIGMAVDANILIFERLKEELKAGKSLAGSIEEAFKRAWPAIRDGNISTIITSVILYVFATGLIKGFALTLGIGVLISMFSAIIVTKNFLKFFIGGKLESKERLWR